MACYYNYHVLSCLLQQERTSYQELLAAGVKTSGVCMHRTGDQPGPSDEFPMMLIHCDGIHAINVEEHPVRS